VLPLSDSPLCDDYIAAREDQSSYDLSVYLCEQCSFVQINTIIDPKYVYRNYLYETTSSHGLREHFQSYANQVCEALNKYSSRLTVDIGSNDGTLLEYFKANNHDVLGIEPATQIAVAATKRGINTLPEFFDEKIASDIVTRFGRAEIITINNLFANVDHLNKFTKGLDVLLDDDGVLVIESSYLIDMIDNMVFDFIYHEHLSYFSILPLVNFFGKFGLKLIRLHKVATKGGSLRYFWARKESFWKVDAQVNDLIEKEQLLNVGPTTFDTFWMRIEGVKRELLDFLQSIEGSTIAAYGASATSTTLLSQFELDKYITYIVDDNTAKHNLLSPGFHIPVFPSEVLYERKPKYVLILAWRYLEQIQIRHKEFINDGGRFIVPLPNLKIIGNL
jgi:hypothetical protein